MEVIQKLENRQTKNKEARSNIAHCHIIEHLAGMPKAAGLLINKMEAQSEKSVLTGSRS